MRLETLSTDATLSVVHRPAVSASPGSLLEMHILRHLQPTESKIVEVGPRYLCFHKFSRVFLFSIKFKKDFFMSYTTSMLL